jgi:hypothetical protein
VGYNDTSKPYMIFIPTQRKKVMSIDVKFKYNLASSRSQDSSIVIEDNEQQAMKDKQ